MSLPFDLVIFDCDGVVVDTEVLSDMVLARYLGELGLDITPQDCQERFLGMTLGGVRTSIETEDGLPMPDDFIDQIRQRDRTAFETDLKAIGGFPDVLTDIGLPFCMGSNGSLAKMRTTLGLTGLWEAFHPNIFSAYDVGVAKPDPGLFLHAARTMGASPDRCLVIEDSKTGVKAGVAAGMTVFGFCGGSHCGPGHSDALLGAGAKLTFDHMDALPALISDQ